MPQWNNENGCCSNHPPHTSPQRPLEESKVEGGRLTIANSNGKNCANIVKTICTPSRDCTACLPHVYWNFILTTARSRRERSRDRCVSGEKRERRNKERKREEQFLSWDDEKKKNGRRWLLFLETTCKKKRRVDVSLYA
jgi:hypothetical protein